MMTIQKVRIYSYLVLFIILSTSLGSIKPKAVHAQVVNYAWGEPQNISNSPGYAEDHPVILGDTEGRLHVFWIGWDQPGSIQEASARSIHYTRLEAGIWTLPNSIQVSGNDKVYDDPAIDIDQDGLLYLTWSDGSNLYYSHAYGGNAESAKSWVEPKVIASPAHESSVKVDSKGFIHVVYTRHDRPTVWHTYSPDKGATWTQPITAGTIDKLEGVRGLRMAISDDDTLHVAWSLDKYPEGWPSKRLLYTRSIDGGGTWESPKTITSREMETYTSEGAPWYLNVATDNGAEVYLTWDGAPNHQRWFQQSDDRGETWLPAIRIFEDNDRGRNLYNPIVVDSLGNLHVVTANYTEIRYTTFDGKDWSQPVALGPVSQPQLAITEGNLLHLVRRQILGDEVEIWYNSHRVNAPSLPPKAYPALVTKDSIRTESTATATPTPAQNSDWGKDSKTTASNSAGPLILGVIPVILLIFMTILFAGHRE